MTLNEIEIAFRNITDDNEQNYRWPFSAVCAYANKVVNDICRQAKVLKDGSITIVITAGTKDYLLDGRIFDVEDEGVKLATLKSSLKKCSCLDFDDDNFSWETDTGNPTAFALDYKTGYLTLNYRPLADDTARIRAFLMPSKSLANHSDVPEIPLAYHDFIPEMMCRYAYDVEDAEVLNPGAVKKFYTIGYDRGNPDSYMNQIINMERAKRPLRRPSTSNGGFF